VRQRLRQYTHTLLRPFQYFSEVRSFLARPGRKKRTTSGEGKNPYRERTPGRGEGKKTVLLSITRHV